MDSLIKLNAQTTGRDKLIRYFVSITIIKIHYSFYLDCVNFPQD